MQRWLIAAGALLAVVACDRGSTVAGPNHSAPTADAVASDASIYIVNFDETQTTQDAVTTGILNTGAGVVQFDNLSMVAALATPAQLLTISALPGLEGVYANKQLDYYMLHESVPSIRADAVHVAGITGKGIGVAILDSGIDGLYNSDVAYPTYTVANVKVLYNQNDLFTFGKDAPKPIRKGATLVVENLPNSETSVGHGTHVAGIVAARGTSSNGYYTGVAPGASLIGVAAGCKIGVTDPTNSEAHCMLDDGSNPLVPTNNEPRAHVLADFSSRGIPDDPLYHPDITAPGVHIVSTRASTGTVLNGDDANHDVRICQIGALNLPYYTCASGTSMATPHIAGVVALMQEAAGGTLKPDQVITALTSTARPLPGYGTWEVGAGFVDAYAAVMKVRK